MGSFAVTFKVREPDNVTEVTLVNAETNGNGGLTVTANGGGSYTASYTWDPSDAQALGLYDLYFQVSDGTVTGAVVFAKDITAFRRTEEQLRQHQAELAHALVG